ncbi:class I SAM-dependent methyltransferase [Sphaerisporangium sp. NPDC051011]|uniref:class I SAM-dependent methyltransferase n=1 Tax=Sphaerisporangium sp. NPDC051011 TaxID=3155792 RepID=UPI0033DCD291
MTAPFTDVHEAHIKRLQALEAHIDDEGLLIGDTHVMFFAEAELMSMHADALLSGTTRANILEVGLGLGVFAEQAAAHRCATYTAIEPHPQVASLTQERVLRRVTRDTVVHVRPWQLVRLAPRHFDAIMYDTWPPDGLADADFEAFVEHVALPSLRPGGRFSFFSSGASVSPRRAAILSERFRDWSEEQYTLPPGRIPIAWTKPTTDFTIPVAVR